MSIQTNFPAIKPTLLLDFANTEELDPRITFTRASTATYYGTETAKAEENLFIRSQDFAFGTSSTTGWNKTRTTVGSAVTAPDGTTTAEPVTQAAGQTTSGFVAQSASVTANPFVVSVFAKPNGKDFLRFVEEIGTGSARSSWINVSTGVAGTTNAGHTITVTAAAQGFYRVSIALTPNATRTALVYFSLADTDNSTTVTDSGGLILWGAQLEQRDAVTAYTPTTTQTITNYIPQLLTAASGVARFDHNPTTFESLGLLIEESRTNLLLYSEQFDNAYWTKTAASITANTIVAPDGTLIGDKLVEDTANTAHNINRSQGVTIGASYAFTVYAKAAERSFFRLQSFNATGDAENAVFDLATGTIFSQSGTSASTITPVGNGWYRCSVIVINDTDTSSTLSIQLFSDGTTSSYTGNGYSGIYIWGASLEAGAFATSYIPTVASQVTRAADAASMTGTNFSDWYNAAEGTFYAQFIPASSDFGGNKNIFLASDGTTSNFVGLRYASTGTQASMAATTSAVSQANVATGTMVAGTSYKLAGVYEANDFAASRNAGTVGTDTSGTVPVVTQAEIGMLAGAAFGTQTISKIAYYPIRVSNTNLQALTS